MENNPVRLFATVAFIVIALLLCFESVAVQLMAIGQTDHVTEMGVAIVLALAANACAGLKK